MICERLISNWLVINYQWLISNILQSAVASATIILAYISFLQIQNSKVSIHIIELKELIRLWQQHLSSNKVALAEEIDSSRDTSTDILYLSSLRNLENQALFKDIVHHFPDLGDFWNGLKALSINYRKEGFGLIEKIQEYIKQKSKDHNFDFESEIDKGFPFTVYLEIVSGTKDKHKVYDYSIRKVVRNGVEKSELFYQHNITGNGYFLAFIEPERIDEVKDFHIEMIKECEKIYLSDIKNIIEWEKKTEESHKELESRLGKIIHYMVFPHMDCEFVKLI